MGYTITIGQLSIEKNIDDGLDCSCISFGAEGVHDEKSPAFGEPTDHENQRWPSYSAWSNFMRGVGLYDVFFYDSGHLIGGHPGVRLVTQDLVLAVQKALADYRQTNPDIKAEFTDGDVRTGFLCRLIWLDYWVNWAINNCETPVIANT